MADITVGIKSKSVVIKYFPAESPACAGSLDPFPRGVSCLLHFTRVYTLNCKDSAGNRTDTLVKPTSPPSTSSKPEMIRKARHRRGRLVICHAGPFNRSIPYQFGNLSDYAGKHLTLVKTRHLSLSHESAINIFQTGNDS